MKHGPFNADNVSPAQMSLVGFVLRQAAGQIERAERLLDDSEITPAEAAETLNTINRAVSVVMSTCSIKKP